jgi:hypothetical protein
MAILAAVFASAMGGKNVKPGDFVPDWSGERPELSPEQLQAKAVAALGQAAPKQPRKVIETGL